MNQITYIPLDDIVFDSQQPRKFFDEAAHRELVQSVKEMGVLQPILVQPGGQVTDLNGSRQAYMIICGERRYRAAWEAELEEIPAVIREGLSSEEVLEIQITENLQRKDVNPMEEGIAFAKLYSRYSIEEIAKRVGKSEKYVAQRISLSDLIEPWQQLVYNGSITLTDAYKLARQGKEAQQEIFKACREDHDADDQEPIKKWVLQRALEDHDCNLTEAKFDTEDEELYPEAGACTGCRYNSANQPLLFADLGTNKICHNSPCYIKKENAAYIRNLKEALEDPNVVLLSNGYGHDKEERAKVENVRAMGVEVLERNQFQILEEPTPLETWEEFLKTQKEDYEWDRMTDKERKESLKEWAEDHAGMSEEHQAELEEYNRHIDKARDGFVIAGYREGTSVKVVLTGKASKAGKIAAPNASLEEQELANLELEINGIETREDRAKELDREKVLKQLMDGLFGDEGSYPTSNITLKDHELPALVMAMLHHVEWGVKEMVAERLKCNDADGYGFDDMAIFKALKQCQDIHNAFAYAARLFIVSKLKSTQLLDPEKWANAAALYHLAEHEAPLTVETIEMEQKQKADKRASNVEKRLAILCDKREKLQEEIQRKKNEAAAKKAQEATKSKSKSK